MILCTKQGGIIMLNIRPITDLRNTNEISDICHATADFCKKYGIRTGEPVVNTF